MKKNIFLFIALFISTSTLFSQELVQSLKEAKEIASKEHKSIIMVFQGSDWCAPCIKLDKSIWSTSEFKKLAQDNFVMLKVDFPRRRKNSLSKEKKKSNNTLAEKYNPRGFFPFVAVLDSKGELLGNLSYEKTTPTAYFKKLKSFEK